MGTRAIYSGCRFGRFISIVVVFLAMSGCQQIVPDLKVIKDSDTNTDTSTHTSTDSSTDTDTNTNTDTATGQGTDSSTDSAVDTSSDTTTDTATVVDTATDTMVDTGTDSESDSETLLRAQCAAGGGYWYDETDVQQNTVAGFEALSPTCHDTPTQNCPVLGVDASAAELIWGMRADGTFLRESINVSDIWIGGDSADASPHPITNVFSTIRCMNYLSTLALPHNRVESIDLLNNEFLTYLYLSDNVVLESVGLPQNAGLKELYLQNNDIRELDLSHQLSLERLDVYSNKLTVLDLRNHTELESVNLSYNRLTSILLPQSAQWLDAVELGYNPNLATLVIPDCSAIANLSVNDTAISVLDVSGCTNLQTLNISATAIQTVDVSAAGDKFSVLYAVGSGLLEVNLENNPNIYEVQVYGSSKFGSLQLPAETPRLHLLYLNSTSIKELDISGADSLDTLHATGGNVYLRSLDFSEKSLLSNIMLWENGFTSVDLSDCVLLPTIDFSGSRITTIVLPASENVETLNLASNEITKINIPLPGVTSIDLSNNRLNYSGGAGDSLSFAECTSLVNLDVNSNSNLVLRIDQTTFPDTFLTSVESRIYMSQEQWDQAVVDAQISWAFDSANGYAHLSL